jgi:hypothetical protein
MTLGSKVKKLSLYALTIFKGRITGVEDKIKLFYGIKTNPHSY